MLPSATTVTESPNNPRKSFDEASLNELAASIKAQGILSPLVVWPVDHHFEIVAGARRYRAARLAGLEAAPTYNPALLWNQTRQNRGYREETREMDAGERIRFMAPEKVNHIRSGDFVTVELIEPNLSACLDNGKSVDLDTEAAEHIDYGYAVDSVGNLAAGRVILAGEATQLSGLEDNLARLNSSICELSVYTSNASQSLQVDLAQSTVAAETLSKSVIGATNLSVEGPSVAESIIEEIGLHL
ncbi:ParB/RepB/Spo0J family partition protein [Telmatobacter bradus]|uniref:ParB N-terminal domain-containing protein n=1 Tax=Telmatobacter bradus TaxID=474953 RepID=UPI003B434F65